MYMPVTDANLRMPEHEACSAHIINAEKVELRTQLSVVTAHATEQMRAFLRALQIRHSSMISSRNLRVATLIPSSGLDLQLFPGFQLILRFPRRPVYPL